MRPPNPRKHLSPATERLVEALYRSRGFLEQLFATDPRIGLLRKIADAGEPAAIPDLLPLVLSGDKTIAARATEAIERLLGTIAPADYARFDEYIRQKDIDWKWRRARWSELRVDDVRYLSRLREGTPALLGVMSGHPSGYLREAAVRELGKINSGAELPFLLMRANDWVPNIREITRGLLLSRMRQEYVSHVFYWLPLVVRLSKKQRGKQEELVGTITGLFNGPEAIRALLAGFDSEDKLVKRFCCKALLGRENSVENSFLERALREDDFRIRMMAARALMQKTPSEENRKLMESALHSPFSGVRLEALKACRTKYPEVAERELERALLDESAPVREEAQFYLNQSGKINPRQFYLEQLAAAEGKKLCVSLKGLGETGTKADATVASQFLNRKEPQVRAAVLRAIAKLDPGYEADIFLAALSDLSRRVSREAVAGLLKRANGVGGERLWAAFQRCSTRGAKRGVLFLIARLSRWESLGYLLLAMGDPDNGISEVAERYKKRLKRRWNRSFVAPTEEQAARLGRILAMRDLLISPKERLFLEGALKTG